MQFYKINLKKLPRLLSWRQCIAGYCAVCVDLCLPLLLLFSAKPSKHKTWPSNALRMRSSRRFKTSLEEGTWRQMQVDSNYSRGKLQTLNCTLIKICLSEIWTLRYGRCTRFALDTHFIGETSRLAVSHLASCYCFSWFRQNQNGGADCCCQCPTQPLPSPRSKMSTQAHYRV